MILNIVKINNYKNNTQIFKKVYKKYFLKLKLIVKIKFLIFNIILVE